MIGNRDFTPMEVMARALGLQPDIIDDAFALKDRMEQHRAGLNSLADYLLEIYTSGMLGDGKSYEMEMGRIMSLLGSMEQADQETVLNRIAASLMDDADLAERIFQQFLTNPAYAAMFTMNPSMKKMIEEQSNGQ